MQKRSLIRELYLELEQKLPEMALHQVQVEQYDVKVTLNGQEYILILQLDGTGSLVLAYAYQFFGKKCRPLYRKSELALLLDVFLVKWEREAEA